MRSIRRSVFVVAVVMALGAVASASASASSWYDGGAELASSAPLATSTTMTENVQLYSAGVIIECSSVELKSADIASHTGGQIEHLVYKGCSFVDEPCSLSSSTIESKPLTMTAALGKNSPEDTLLLKPTSGTVVAEYKIVGAECGLAGGVKLQGQMKFALPKGREELAEQELLIQTTNGAGELRWGSAEISLSGKAKLKLASGSKWSFH